MLEFFKRFRKRKKSVPCTPREQRNHVKSFEIGDMVRLTFKDPSKMGFTKANEITFTRFNQSELNKRTITGTVSKNWYEDYPLHEQLIEITVVVGPNVYRKYLFLSQEIEDIRKI